MSAVETPAVMWMKAAATSTAGTAAIQKKAAYTHPQKQRKIQEGISRQRDSLLSVSGEDLWTTERLM